MKIAEGFAALERLGWRVHDFAPLGAGRNQWWLSVYYGGLGRFHPELPAFVVDGADPKVTFQAAIDLIDGYQSEAGHPVNVLHASIEAQADATKA